MVVSNTMHKSNNMVVQIYNLIAGKIPGGLLEKDFLILLNWFSTRWTFGMSLFCDFETTGLTK